MLCFSLLQLCNAYTELNDPVVQRQRFADQLKVVMRNFGTLFPLKFVYMMLQELIICPLDLTNYNARTDNRVMTKLWPWMRHFVLLLNMVCLQLVDGVWVLIDLLCC